jgi:hypothetical protein
MYIFNNPLSEQYEGNTYGIGVQYVQYVLTVQENNKTAKNCILYGHWPCYIPYVNFFFQRWCEFYLIFQMLNYGYITYFREIAVKGTLA